MENKEQDIEQSEEDGLYRIRHSAAHVLAQAVLEMRPGSTLGLGEAPVRRYPRQGCRVRRFAAAAPYR